ncbi:radical SAM family heme chaperone HemW [Bartonella sp. HY406]|uniref:radical SAM family heme chaperone HemW n=1 Tax=Bartonella sp. HY406 TaxID=2979331 RepID=UPI0021C62D85|nr:radical SAM family heme chaperone HemW [Bartonella sp. HY406]UXN03536.1 radical SAM family heme chaperone HemW [Bartonella sp. HY406]
MREPFGIYIHWPFCAAKCPYCDFNSHVRMRGIDEPRFRAAFSREMATLRERIGHKTITSIFLGGGTPSLMEPQTVAHLLNEVARHWTIENGAEITMEANPSSVEADRFRAYKSAGVNRLSLGVQALDDAELKRLGRIHDVKQAIYAIGLARDIFPRLSFDLIYARPNQTPQSWESELNQAIDLAADHLSLYQLTIEEGTAFQRLYEAGKLKLPEPEDAALLYDITQNITAKRGLPAYEISNHAVPGAESQHNLLYWRYQQYLGIGPGAHGRFIEGDKRTVTITEKLPEKWCDLVEEKGHGIIEEEYLTKDNQADEMLLMGLRLYEGLDIHSLETLRGKPLDNKVMAELQEYGLIEMVGNSRLRASDKGRILLDHIIGKLAA